MKREDVYVGGVYVGPSGQKRKVVKITPAGVCFYRIVDRGLISIHTKSVGQLGEQKRVNVHSLCAWAHRSANENEMKKILDAGF